MKNMDIARILFILTSFAIVFVSGVFIGIYWGVPKVVSDYVTSGVAQVMQEWATLTKTKPEHYLQPARYRGEGVTRNQASQDDRALVFMSGFFEDGNELRLIRRDGTLVARWPARFSEIFPDPSHLSRPPQTDWNVDVHGALMLPDGSVVFNFEYAGLVKLDRCGEVLWALPRATHHSVERAQGGGFWVPGRRHYAEGADTPFDPFEPPFDEDTILRISEDGKILAELSVPALFYDNGLEAILTANGHAFRRGMSWDQEIVHLNKVAELSHDIADDFPAFDAGDLALSVRELNLVMVIDPNDGAVKWWRIGPWLRQHDPEFRPGGTIVVFNNNLYETAFGDSESTTLASTPPVTNILEVDPASGRRGVIYGDGEDQGLVSVWRGKLELTPGGGLLITEFEGGRVLEVDASGNVVWEYVNRYSDTEVAEVTEARLYPEDYFTVTDWTCGAGSS